MGEGCWTSCTTHSKGCNLKLLERWNMALGIPGGAVLKWTREAGCKPTPRDRCTFLTAPFRYALFKCQRARLGWLDEQLAKRH